jgi:hypothetical protein
MAASFPGVSVASEFLRLKEFDRPIQFIWSLRLLDPVALGEILVCPLDEIGNHDELFELPVGRRVA